MGSLEGVVGGPENEGVGRMVCRLSGVVFGRRLGVTTGVNVGRGDGLLVGTSVEGDAPGLLVTR